MDNAWTYFIIPLISALIGWGTNWVAVAMMFHPIQFIGWQPYWGWQGVVPANAPRMAKIAVDLMLTKLIRVEHIFAKLDARRLTAAMEHRLDEMLEQIISEVMLERAPRVWEMLPLWVKDKIYAQVCKEAPDVIAGIIDDVKSDIREVFDLEYMITDALIEDRALLNEIFQQAGKKEFAFLIRSGLYFGFLFGVPSMLVWIFYRTWWTLPVGGMLVGYATNWLAIKMIFQPQAPRKVGPWTWQGLFLKRQQEVASVYAELINSKLLTAERITDTILRGPASDRLFQIIERNVNRAIDETAGLAKPYIVVGVGTEEYIALKHQVCEKIMAYSPDPMRYTYEYTEEAMGIEPLLRTRMQALTPAEFEGVLRPAYQQDEWKLITVGAVLGLVAGTLQFLMIGSA